MGHAAGIRGAAASAARRAQVVVERGIGRARAVPAVGRATRAFMRYQEAGGGLVSRGLAFAILFAIVPALVLVASLAGIIISDPVTHTRIAEGLAAQFPPLAPLLGDALDAALGASPTVSIVSVAILVWSASGVVRALDVAMGLVFREQAMPRSPLRLVAQVLGAGVAAVAVAGILVAATVAGPLSNVVGIGIGARWTPLVALVAVVFVAYRFLPLVRPPWRAALLPAVVTSLAVALLTGAFAIIGPLAFGSAQFYGAFAVVFLGIVWLGFSTDLFLLGAAWTAVRAEEGR